MEHLRCPIVAAHLASGNGSFPTSLSKVVGISLSYDELYFIFSWVHGVKDVVLENRIRSGKCLQYISRWHNENLFTFSASAHSEDYVWISVDWKEELECYRVLMVPTPLVFSYYSDILLQDGHVAPAIWHITITEYIVIALLSLLGADRDSAVGAACIQPLKVDDCGVFLVLLPYGVRWEVYDIRLFLITGVSKFDPFASLITYSRRSKDDWAWIDPIQR